MRVRPVSLLSAGLAAIALGGCGIADPYQHTHPTPTSTTAATAAASTPTTTTSSLPDTRTAAATVRRYATLSINWTSRTLAARQRQLEQLAIGGARAQAAQTAATYGAHSTLQHSGVANRGQITSIAPGQGPETGRWVITTRETTTGRGDYHGLPSQPHVYYAQLTHTPRGWRISTWSPQN